MLEMSRKRTIDRNGRPAVTKNLHFMTTCIDHWLNRQHHAELSTWPLPLGPIIWDLRVFVKCPTYTVTNEFPYHPVSEVFNIILIRVANIEYSIALQALFNPQAKTFLGHIHQLLGLWSHFADCYCSAESPIPSFVRNSEV